MEKRMSDEEYLKHFNEYADSFLEEPEEDEDVRSDVLGIDVTTTHRHYLAVGGPTTYLDFIFDGHAEIAGDNFPELIEVVLHTNAVDYPYDHCKMQEYHWTEAEDMERLYNKYYY